MTSAAAPSAWGDSGTARQATGRLVMPGVPPGTAYLPGHGGFEDIKFLVSDRGPNFTASFDAVFQAAGTRILRTAVQAPRMNATCERLIGTLRRELLDRTLILARHACAPS